MRAELKPYIVFILAGNYAEAEEYARCYLHSQQGFTYLDSMWHVRGLNGLHFVRCGTWQRRTDIAEVEAELARRGIDVTAEFPDDRIERAGEQRP